MSLPRRASTARTAAGLALLLGGYTAWVRRRNRRLLRPPVRDPDGLAYPSRRIVYSDGVDVTYLDAGSGSPIVMIPGADGMKETFRYQVPALASRHRVIVADMRARHEPDASFDRLADDVAELMDECGIGRAVVVGQSLGGAVALRFGTRYPERVRGLVISNSLTHITLEHLGLNRTGLIPLARFTTRYLPTTASRTMARLWSRAEVWIFDDSPGWANVVEYALRTGSRTVSVAASKGRVDLFREVDLRPELRHVRAPTLVVRGDRDFYMPPRWWDDILELVPSSWSVEVPETGHCSHISMPGTFNQTILDWVREIDASGVVGFPGQSRGEVP
jgi:pimeloyl-ACP methyl ester carboxylesterase